jgi:hypothetical protein
MESAEDTKAQTEFGNKIDGKAIGKCYMAYVTISSLVNQVLMLPLIMPIMSNLNGIAQKVHEDLKKSVEDYKGTKFTS